MILVLHALVFSGLLFCAEQKFSQVTLNNCVDTREPQVRMFCTDRKMGILPFDTFLKLYHTFPALNGIFERTTDENNNFLIVPMDSKSLFHFSQLITNDVHFAHQYILALPVCETFKMLELSHSLGGNRFFIPLFKNMVLLKFLASNGYETRFFDKFIWQKFAPFFMNQASVIEPDLVLENYSINYSHKEFMEMVESLKTAVNPVLTHHWFASIATRTMNITHLNNIQTFSAKILPQRVVFNDDWKRFTLLTDEQKAIEFCFNDETYEYEKNSEFTMLEDCWYREDNSRIGRHGRNFYKIDNKKRYLTNVDKKTTISHVTFNKNILAISSEKNVILKDVSQEAIRSEKHTFAAIVKCLVPYKQGFLVQQKDGSVHQLRVGIKEHIKIPLNVPNDCTIQRLMFNDMVLVLNMDNNLFNVFFYALNNKFNTDDRYSIKLTVSPSLMHFQDDAIMCWEENRIYCYNFLQPYVDAVKALTTDKPEKISEIYDTIAQNQ